MDEISGKWLKMANKTAEKKETLSVITEKQSIARKKLVKLSSLTTKSKFERYIRKHTKEEYNALANAIAQEGKIREPITVQALGENGEFLVIDGHHRLKVAKEMVAKGRVEFESVPINIEYFANDEEIYVWMLRNQLGRRNLTPFERAEIGFRISAFLEDLALKKKQHKEVDNKLLSKWIKAPDIAKIDYAEIVSEITGVPRTTVIRAKKLYYSATEDVKEGIRAGDISISKAYQELIKADKEKKKAGQTARNKRNLTNAPLSIKDLESVLDSKILRNCIGIGHSSCTFKLVQKSKAALLYVVVVDGILNYVKVLSGKMNKNKDFANFLIYISHEKKRGQTPKNDGLIGVNSNGSLKIIEKCKGFKGLTTEQELTILRSIVVDRL